MYGFEDDVIAYQSLAMPLATRQRNGHYICTWDTTVCAFTNACMLCFPQVLEAMHEERHHIIVQSPPPGCPKAIYSIMVDCWWVHSVLGA